MAGCGAGPVAVSTGVQDLAIRGVIHGGQNPVSGSSIGLYRAGTTGLASAATNILTRSVTSDAQGNFTLTGAYTCANANDQMYVVATGGNPGLSGNGTNPAISMVAALGSCSTLSSTQFIFVDEVTTAAAAYALTGFATDARHIGATSTNAIGIQNAFLDAGLLANTTNGNAATLPSTQTIETAKLYSLADILASCVNSDGSAPCTALFGQATLPGTPAPTDTFQAALDVARHPANNVAGLFALIPAAPPFPATLSAAPHDWTMSMSLTGGGVSVPTTLGIDSKGNVWVADYNGNLTGYSAQGVPFSPTGTSTGSFTEIFGLAIDGGDNVWITSEESPIHGTTKGSLMQLYGFQSATPGTLKNYVSDNSINYPYWVYVDSINGYIDVANNANGPNITGTVSVFNSDGTLKTVLGNGYTPFPDTVYADANGGVWTANQTANYITHSPISGTPTTITCCSGGDGLALDAGGNAWVSNYYSSSVSEVSNTNTVLINQATGGGIASPAKLAIDGAQNIWVANFHSASLSEVAGSFSTAAPGTPLSPANGYGLDANLLQPLDVQVDRSGNVWVTSYSNNQVVMFFGLAAPTKTPLQNVPTAP